VVTIAFFGNYSRYMDVKSNTIFEHRRDLSKNEYFFVKYNEHLTRVMFLYSSDHDYHHDYLITLQNILAECHREFFPLFLERKEM